MELRAKTVVISSSLDIVIARTAAREFAKDLGFGAVDLARITTAVSELARNIVLYAGTGHVTVGAIPGLGRTGIEIVCEDWGPGIANIDEVTQDGSSIAYGTGIGIPGARRLMDEFRIRSKEGGGTTIICRKWPR